MKLGETKGNFRRLFMVLSFALLAATALSAQDVKYNFMPGTDFSKYH